MRRFSISFFALAAILAGPFSACPAWGDVFLLTNGGRIEGTRLPPFHDPPTVYVIETSGGKVAIRSNQVKTIVEKSREEKLYEKYLPKMPNTADGHWKMAQWCLKNNLTERRKHHLERVIAFQSNHEAARRGLGYTKVDGRWFQPDEYMLSQGMVRYDGQWHYPQDIEILKAKHKTERQQKQVRQRVKTWRGWLNTRRAQEGLAHLKAIDDPLAVPALVELLLKEKEPLELKMIYIERLGKLRHTMAVGALIQASLDDDIEQVRDACLEELEKFGARQAIDAYLQVLQGVGKKTLPVEEYQQINRAGVGLARMKDPSVVPQLIDALITEYKYKVGGRGGGNLNASFSPQGGFSFGGGGRAKIAKQKVVNPGVRDALTLLTGQNFGAERGQWRAWYAQANAPQNVNLRRRVKMNLSE